MYHLPLQGTWQYQRVEGGETGPATVPGDIHRDLLTNGRPALWTWVELREADARMSDNFLHLCPGSPMTVHITPAGSLSLEQLRDQLTVRSLVDTYR